MARIINILIVEDDENSRRGLERVLNHYLAHKGVVILPAESLQSGLQMARLRAPGLAIVDLSLKDSKPEETLKSLHLFGCDVIVTSGIASGEMRNDIYRYGALDYVEKPIIFEVFVEKVSRALSRRFPESDFSEVQRHAQHDVTQKTIASGPQAAFAAAANSSSKWIRMVMPMAGCTLSVLIFFAGRIEGAYSAAQKKGAAEQAKVDHLGSIDAELKEIKEGNKDRDKVIRKVERNQVLLMAKSGISVPKDDD